MGNRTTRVEFAERVQTARTNAGLSVLELATRSGIAYTTLRRRLEGAPGSFSLDELDAIAEVTGTSFEHLVAGTPVESAVQPAAVSA